MAVTPFRQLIRPGDQGKDVVAVKDGMLRKHVNGSGALGSTNFAGRQFVHCVRQVQLHHGLKQDGIYGKDTHAVIAPLFTARDKKLYQEAALRRPAQPGLPPGDLQETAKKLLALHKQGRYHADNSGELTQIQRSAAGEAVWSPMGKWIHLDVKTLKVIVWLIEKGYTIGTYAMCSDHPYDSPRGHAGGRAVDISSINGHALSGSSALTVTRQVAKLLHSGTPEGLHPWQLICDGCGYQHDAQISACTLPDPSFYGYATMSQHRNHIHVGF